MVERVETAVVKLWEHDVGAVSWVGQSGYAVFEFEPAFLRTGLDISPIHMPVAQARAGDALYAFPGLSRETFLGLPGALADSLPDKFGNRIIESWLVRNGRDPGSFSPVERLCYTGRRAMGALEFAPPVNRQFDRPVPVEIAQLVELAQSVVSQRMALDVDISSSDKENAEALLDDPFITLYGDSFVSLDFSRFMASFTSHNKLGIMTVYKNYDKYDRSNTEIKGNLVTRYSKNVRTPNTIYIDYGVNAFRKDALKYIPRYSSFSLEELFVRLIEKEELLAFEVKDRFFEIGSIRGLQEFEQHVAEGVK